MKPKKQCQNHPVLPRKTKSKNGWVVSDCKNADMQPRKNFTVFETDEVMVISRRNDGSVEVNARKKVFRKANGQKIKQKPPYFYGNNDCCEKMLGEKAENNEENSDDLSVGVNVRKGVVRKEKRKKIKLKIPNFDVNNDHCKNRPEEKAVNSEENSNHGSFEVTARKGVLGKEKRKKIKRTIPHLDVNDDCENMSAEEDESCEESGDKDSASVTNMVVKLTPSDSRLRKRIKRDCDCEYTEEVPNPASVCGGSKEVVFYQLINDSRYIVHVPYSTAFSFNGKLQITVLYGEVEVFGFTVNHLSKNRTLDIYSPRRCMQLQIIPKEPSISFSKFDLNEALHCDMKLEETDAKALNDSVGPNDVLLLAERLESIHSPIFRHYFDNLDLFYEDQVFQDGSSKEKHLDCILDVTKCDDRKGFTEGSKWSEIIPGRCTVVCGGKGVGKSTLFKYLVNKHLSQMESALCLDFDPGQNEFTAPGSVIATLVEKPLLGPNFTHLQEPVAMAYIGTANVALDPIKYVHSVQHVIKMCRNDSRFQNIPWFVNTMGFNKGFGLDIMVNIIRILQPDVVVQISSTDKTKNYEHMLKPNLVQVLDVLRLVQATGVLNYKLYKIYSCSRLKGIGFQSGFNPAQLRDLVTVSYFSRVVSFPYCTINAAQPYWMHFSKIVLVIPEMVAAEHILQVFNACLVGLCNLDGIDSEIQFDFPNPAYPLKIAVRPEIQPSYGIGLVRGFDLKEKKIYIITPVPEDVLQNVNCLSLSAMSPPTCFFFKQRLLNQVPLYVDVSRKGDQTLKPAYKYVPSFDINRRKKR